MNSSNKLIDKIKKQNIKPTPKWYFKLKNMMIWSLYGIFVLLGAKAFAVILFAIQQTDFEILSHISHSKMELFLGLLPFFWIIILVFFLLFATFGLKNSKKGYKRTVANALGISVALSVLLGTFFFLAGGAKKLENVFETRLEFYKSINEKKIQIWMNPEEGNLAGTIESASGNTLKITDFHNKTWIITYTDAFVPPIVLLEKGEKIKLIGKKTGDDAFDASEIRPWGGRGQKGKGHGKQGGKPYN